MSRALIEAIDARVAEKQKGKLRRINRSDVVREVLLREFGVTETEEE